MLGACFGGLQVGSSVTLLLPTDIFWFFAERRAIYRTDMTVANGATGINKQEAKPSFRAWQQVTKGLA